MAIDSTQSTSLASKTFRIAANVFSSPFRGVAWVGNKLTRKPFAKLDETAFGKYVKPRAYRIGGPSFVVGDAGFIGFALEQAKHLHNSAANLQLSGASGTFLAHGFMALIGDEEPLALQWIDKGSALPKIGQPISRLRPVFEFITKYKHINIPAIWTILGYNGFTLAAATVTKPLNMTLVQLSDRMTEMISNPHVQNSLEAIIHSPVYANATDVLMKAPEFMQGIAILTGCVGLAVNQYLKLSNENAIGRSQEKRDAVNAQAERIGDFAGGMLSSCTVLTLATGLVDLSPSLIFCSTPAFLLGNYCQTRMARIRAPISELKS